MVGRVLSGHTTGYIVPRLRFLVASAWGLAGTYLIWVGLHYASAWAYSAWCTPLGIVGFVTSPFLVASPHCSALRWCIARGSETITGMWVVIGSWLTTRLVVRA